VVVRIVRSVSKHRVVRYTTELTAVFVVIIFGMIVLSRATRPVAPELPQQLLPGQSLPNNAECDTLPPKGGWQYCHVLDGDTVVELTYDTERQVIVHSDFQLGTATIGELVLSWGTPTGIDRRDNWPIRMQWGQRFVYIYANPFSPNNNAYSVHYVLEPRAAAPWTGFTNPGD